MIDLGTGLKFRAMVKNQLRDAMLRDLDWLDLERNLMMEAGNLGLEVNKWAWSLDGPFEAEARDVIAEARQTFADWKNHGKPRPPEISGFPK